MSSIAVGPACVKLVMKNHAGFNCFTQSYFIC